MIVKIIILLLFLIPLFPEIVNLDFTFELRSLIFAIGVTILLGFWSLGGNCYKRANSIKQFIFQDKNKLRLIDVAFIAVTILTVISFVTKTENIYAFHYVFVQVGMAVVYFFVRTTKVTKNTKQENIDNSFQCIQRVQWLNYGIVGIGFIVAIIGLVQFVMGKPVVSTFGRTSYLGCFLAMNAAIALGIALQLRVTNYELRFKKFNIGFWLAVFAFFIILCVTVLTKSRTAMIATAVVLPIMVFATNARIRKFINNILFVNSIRALVAIILLFVLLIFGGKAIYKIRPMSASGRVLIWKVSAEMFRKNPISGVGFGNFANYYNLYQAEYFASGKGSVVNKMTAGQVRHAYNWYLETAVEFGIFGLIVFGMFWWMILVEVYKVIKNIQYSTRNIQCSSKEVETDYLTFGMAGAVLCFMIMSLFQFPWQIIPTYLFFNVALAWIVNANEYTNLHRYFLTTNGH